MNNPVHNLSAQARSFWAKTGVVVNDFGEELETGMELPQHMLDSARVAAFLWDSWISPGSKKQLRKKLNLDETDTKALVCFLVGAHDIGKATPEFAGQLDSRGNPEYARYRQRIVDVGFEFPLDLEKPVNRCPHSTYSQTIIEDWLVRHFSLDLFDRDNAKSLAHVSGAHHGTTSPENSSGRNDGMLLNLVSDEEQNYRNWQNTWDELLTFIMQVTEAEQALEIVIRSEKGLPLEAQFFLTGFTIMCDWIASNPEYFPYGSVEDQEPRVREAFEKFELPKTWQPENFDDWVIEEIYTSRFGWDGDFTLRPMQKVVVDAARSMPSGGLICIEAPMGQGKTEAGLVAAEILAQRAGKNGVMFAAPTQATANSLFTRVADWAENAATGLGAVSMYLGHSKQNLNKDFSNMRYARIKTYEEQTGGKRKATSYAHTWFSRKKGLLSTMVVGTIDQVLMMALASRHVMLRHLGLGEKAVIIDEVHAYDAYMNVYLKTALYWLGKMRVPVVLMSATLPSNVREELLAEYAKGLGVIRGKKKLLVESNGDDYPVVHTLCLEDKNELKKWEIEQPKETQKFSMQAIGDTFDEIDAVLSLLDDDGGCAAIICNTVARAQEIYNHLLGLGVYSDGEVKLVHSRFISLDRSEMEEELTNKLGKNASSGNGRPYRYIVVGTQVIEQSLDIDFDVMVTDHAPVDLVLQRMGRLHRHKRDDRPSLLKDPVCYIRGIDVLGSEEQIPCFPKAANFIYAESLLLSSYAQLLPYFQGKKLEIPAHVSELVQETYQANPMLPEAWKDHWVTVEAERIRKVTNSKDKAKGAALRNTSREQKVLNNLVDAKEELKEQKAQAKVRETDDTLEVIVIQRADAESYRPLHKDYEASSFSFHSLDKPDHKLAEILAGSTIRLPYQFADKVWKDKNYFDLALDELENNQIDSWQEHYLLKGELALILDEDGEANLAGYALRYSKELGLEVISEEPK